MINIIDPYWWNLGPVPVRNEGLPRIDIGGIYKLSTNAVALTESSVDYGINPCLYSNKIAKRFLCDDCRQKLVIEIKEIDKKD